jgi:outer membrane protein OmpA-like peptidoglycan-associated protein
LQEVRQEVLRERKPVVIHFANNSAHAALTEAEITDIRNAAQISGHLLVDGYTDAFYPDDAGTRLAYVRALNVADVLVEHGVDRHSMRIDFHAAGEFAQDNSTLEGKAFNRRVTVSPDTPKEFLAGR